MAMAYLDFVEERHQVWVRRQQGQAGPWTTDPILASRKFTNVFRVLDPGSQYLLQALNEPGITAGDALARAYLYRMTNRPETWDYLAGELGRWPVATDMNPLLGDILATYRDQGGTVFSSAYIIPNEPGATKGAGKTRGVTNLAYRYFHPDSPDCVTKAFLAETSMERRFYVLLDQPGIGPFVAMQVLTDFGYSPFGADQDEDAFVMAGPGARNGAKHIFPHGSARDAINWCQKAVHQADGVPLLQGRPPSKMDIQNTLCEFSKYARYLLRGGPAGAPYVAAHPGPQPAPVLPAHWQRDAPLRAGAGPRA